jgi:hypothetical protein
MYLLLGFPIQQFYCQKQPLFVNFSIPHCGTFFSSQCPIFLVNMRFCRNAPNSSRNKNKKLHNPCLHEESFSALQNSVVPHWHTKKKFFHQF